MNEQDLVVFCSLTTWACLGLALLATWRGIVWRRRARHSRQAEQAIWRYCKDLSQLRGAQARVAARQNSRLHFDLHCARINLRQWENKYARIRRALDPAGNFPEPQLTLVELAELTQLQLIIASAVLRGDPVSDNDIYREGELYTKGYQECSAPSPQTNSVPPATSATGPGGSLSM